MSISACLVSLKMLQIPKYLPMPIYPKFLFGWLPCHCCTESGISPALPLCITWWWGVFYTTAGENSGKADSPLSMQQWGVRSTLNICQEKRVFLHLQYFYWDKTLGNMHIQYFRDILNTFFFSGPNLERNWSPGMIGTGFSFCDTWLLLKWTATESWLQQWSNEDWHMYILSTYEIACIPYNFQ